MRIRVLVATGAILAAFAVTAAGAYAGNVVDLNSPWWRSSLAPGAYLTAFQEESSGEAVDFATSAGTVECRNEHDHNALSGEVVTNDQTTDEVAFTEGGFGFGESCAFGGQGAAAAPGGFPWKGDLARSGTMRIAGTPAAAVTLELPGPASCVYTRKNLVATSGAILEHEIRLYLTFSNQKFKLDAAASHGTCPKTASMSATFKTQSTAGPVFIHVGQL